VPSVILAAGLLVLLGLGLFVGGVLTGTTALYWGCVAACVVAAALLVVARRRIFAEAPGGEATTAAGGAKAGGAKAGGSKAGGAKAGGDETGGTRSEVPGGPADAKAGEAGPASGGTVAAAGPEAVPDDRPDPPVEDVEVTDLLLVVDLKDEVLVVDEHPRYHLAGCRFLTGQETIPLPLDEARTDGFTPCGICSPDRTLAERERARK
jgi:hypothetical protein